MQYELPADKTAEITLIGTGGGYGESVVVHYGHQQWMVVDSCIDPRDKTCLPLEYLREMGVDLARQVKWIVCTHWHIDHSGGNAPLAENGATILAHHNARQWAAGWCI